jgi:thiamine kinase-like enzyme
MELIEEGKKIIEQKALEYFKKINGVEFHEDDVLLNLNRLSGISNLIFKVYITSDKHEFKVDCLFVKMFGRISGKHIINTVIVDRDLEALIMYNLNEADIGPAIYETDSKTYRIEEYIHNLVPLKNEDMYKPEVLDKIINIFTTYNSIGDTNIYAKLIENNSKEDIYKLLLKDKTTNFINFSKKMLPMAQQTLEKFKKDFIWDDPVEIENLKEIEYYIKNFNEYFYKTLPERGLMVVSHNDAHVLNAMTRADYSKVYLFDHEYASYNFLGFDVANYNIESFFILENEHFPFYQTFITNFEEFGNDMRYNAYVKFIENFAKNKHLFEAYNKFDILVEKAKSKEYYYRMMSMSSLMWFAFGVIYLDFKSIDNKTGFDYFHFCLDRLSVYSKHFKNILNH